LTLNLPFFLQLDVDNLPIPYDRIRIAHLNKKEREYDEPDTDFNFSSSVKDLVRKIGSIDVRMVSPAGGFSLTFAVSRSFTDSEILHRVHETSRPRLDGSAGIWSGCARFGACRWVSFRSLSASRHALFLTLLHRLDWDVVVSTFNELLDSLNDFSSGVLLGLERPDKQELAFPPFAPAVQISDNRFVLSLPLFLLPLLF